MVIVDRGIVSVASILDSALVMYRVSFTVSVTKDITAVIQVITNDTVDIMRYHPLPDPQNGK